MASLMETLAIALQHHQAGRLTQAEGLYRQILQTEPQHPDALHLLGVALHQQGRPEWAVDYIRQALALRPDTAPFHNNLGLACRALGQREEAVAAYRRAIALKPDYANAMFNLGLVLRELRRLDEAIDCYRQAIRLRPDFVDAHNSLGVALKESGNLDEAMSCYRAALELRPDFAEVHYNLGGALNLAGRSDEAIAHYQQALRLKPGYAEAYCNWGRVLADQRKFVEAVACYQQALQLRPDLAEAHCNLGAAWAAQGKFAEAAACYRRALQLNPALAEAYGSLGDALRYTGELSEAVRCFQQDLHYRPEHAPTYNLLGNALKEQGKLDEAMIAYRRAMELQPELRDAQSNFLLASHYEPGLSPAELARLHVEWDDRHAASLRHTWRPHENSLEPTRPLRLGFVSADLGFHPVGSFLVRTLENLNSQDQAVVCYSDRKVVDPISVRFRNAAQRWHEVSGLSDEQLAEQIRQDRIDILFDLSGHTYGNRLLVFARKPAPLQITWIGYEGTTGLRAMDYLLADHHVIPPDAEPYYPERILRLPDSYICYDPPATSPDVGPLPARSRGHVTFASFNNPAKMTPRVVDVWAEILRQVPRSRLVLKYHGLDDPGPRERLEALFASQGIPCGRLELRGWSSFAELLAEHNEVDITLDPFPFSGGATTCNSLWMGVPVITSPGETFASRHGLSYLSALGMTETIAHDHEDYIRLAVSLATDIDRLAAVRSSLRSRMIESPLCDGARHAAALARLLREVWHEHCTASRTR